MDQDPCHDLTVQGSREARMCEEVDSGEEGRRGVGGVESGKEVKSGEVRRRAVKRGGVGSEER